MHPKTLILQVFMHVRLCRVGHRSGGVNLGKDRSAWELAEGIATAFLYAAVTARARMLEHASPLVRLLGQRDALHHNASLLEGELPFSDPSKCGSPHTSGCTARPRSEPRSLLS